MAKERPLFLERASLRRRRLGDAARILPIIALIAVLLPVWWMPDAVSYGGGAVWTFGLWAGLVCVIAVLHGALIRADKAMGRAEQDAPQDDPANGDDDAV